MFRLNDRMALYAYLRELGACRRARIVFEDDPDVYWDDLFFATHWQPPLVLDAITLAMDYIPEEEHCAYLLDILVRVADEYVWSPACLNETFKRQYRELRYDVNPWHDIDHSGDLPF